MKKLLIGLGILTSLSGFAGIVENTVSMVETQYNLACGEAMELKQEIFKPVRFREAISCTDGSGKVKVTIKTEAKAKGQPLYKVEILAASPKTNLDSPRLVEVRDFANNGILNNIEEIIELKTGDAPYETSSTDYLCRACASPNGQCQQYQHQSAFQNQPTKSIANMHPGQAIVSGKAIIYCK